MLEYAGAQQLYIEMKDKFKKRHNYTLMIRFTSKLTQDFKGFYVSSYMNDEGEKRC